MTPKELEAARKAIEPRATAVFRNMKALLETLQVAMSYADEHGRLPMIRAGNMLSDDGERSGEAEDDEEYDMRRKEMVRICRRLYIPMNFSAGETSYLLSATAGHDAYEPLFEGGVRYDGEIAGAMAERPEWEQHGNVAYLRCARVSGTRSSLLRYDHKAGDYRLRETALNILNHAAERSLVYPERKIMIAAQRRVFEKMQEALDVLREAGEAGDNIVIESYGSLVGRDEFKAYHDYFHVGRALPPPFFCVLKAEAMALERIEVSEKEFWEHEVSEETYEDGSAPITLRRPTHEHWAMRAIADSFMDLLTQADRSREPHRRPEEGVRVVLFHNVPIRQKVTGTIRMKNLDTGFIGQFQSEGVFPYLGEAQRPHGFYDALNILLDNETGDVTMQRVRRRINNYAGDFDGDVRRLLPSHTIPLKVKIEGMHTRLRFDVVHDPALRSGAAKRDAIERLTSLLKERGYAAKEVTAEWGRRRRAKTRGRK